MATIDGTSGNDPLTSLAGADDINGLEGDDVITSANSTGPDAISGGDDFDLLNFDRTSLNVDFTFAIADNLVGIVALADGSTITEVERVVFFAGGGNDTLTGGSFDDILSGGAKIDILDGGEGDDVIIGGADDDILNGGIGIDTAHYAGAIGAVTVSLALQGAAQATGGAGSDTLDNFENLTGSLDNDVLAGDDNDNVIDGGAAGRDTLSGGLGTDVLIGGSGIDAASYAYALEGVFVDLSISGFQTIQTGDADSLSGIESVIGSDQDDFLTGNAGLNYLHGGAGNDTIIDGGGNDFLDGGAGDGDTVDFLSGTGIRLDLGLTGAQYVGATAGTDTVRNFEHVLGSGFLDKITGNAAANFIDGNAGNDILDGGLGDDILDGCDDNDTVLFTAATAAVVVDLEAGTATGGSGSDTLIEIENATGTAYNDTLTGSFGDNRLTGGAGDDLVQGGFGDDVMDGGAGIDTLSFAAALDYVVVDLVLLTQQDTGDGFDMFRGFENLIGSDFDDDLHGNALNNDIQGGAGFDFIDGDGRNDTLHGGDDDDLLFGGLGNDTLFGDDGDDFLLGDAGNDMIVGGAGSDTAEYSSSYGRVSVDLAITTQQYTIGQGYDTLSEIENLFGSIYDDKLYGDAADNVISGFIGSDTLTGRGGADTFAYLTEFDSTVCGCFGIDLITDFAAGDILDLSEIDADYSTVADDAFVQVTAFGNIAGEFILTYDGASNQTLLEADIDGDGFGDFGMLFTGDVTALTANWVL